jgi:hypothetical protein
MWCWPWLVDRRGPRPADPDRTPPRLAQLDATAGNAATRGRIQGLQNTPAIASRARRALEGVTERLGRRAASACRESEPRSPCSRPRACPLGLAPRRAARAAQDQSRHAHTQWRRTLAPSSWCCLGWRMRWLSVPTGGIPGALVRAVVALVAFAPASWLATMVASHRAARGARRAQGTLWEGSAVGC